MVLPYNVTWYLTHLFDFDCGWDTSISLSVTDMHVVKPRSKYLAKKYGEVYEYERMLAQGAENIVGKKVGGGIPFQLPDIQEFFSPPVEELPGNTSLADRTLHIYEHRTCGIHIWRRLSVGILKTHFSKVYNQFLNNMLMVYVIIDQYLSSYS